MTTKQLGNILSTLYNSEGANKVTMILLFGVKYSDEIKNAATNSSLNGVVKEIIEFSGLPKSYATEVKKAVALADFVAVR